MKVTQLIGLALTLVLPLQAFAEKDTCQKIRFADTGWTDITVTTALAAEVLKLKGYETKIAEVSVPISFMSMKNRDIDVFLGNWMPSMKNDIKPYLEDGSVETVGTILKGAKYTLAVPKYVYDQGVTSIEQLGKFGDKFGHKVYGIEPGNDGNNHIQMVIADPKYNMKDWKLVESSEQAMLAQASRAIKKKEWIVFLGWTPHPMNKKMELAYLSGASQYFGANGGESTVFINARKNYTKNCPKLGKFLKNFQLDMVTENDLMEQVLDHGKEPGAAAREWLKTHPEHLKKWSNFL